MAKKVELNREQRRKMKRKKVKEFRAELKGLEEQRAELAEEMEKIVNDAKKETRAVTDEEKKKFEEAEAKIKNIDFTIEMEKRAAKAKNTVPDRKKEDEADSVKTEETRAKENAEVRAFCSFIRGTISGEQRADVNLDTGSNGAVVPTTIAKKIIDKVVDICPIYQLSDRSNVKGTLTIPYYDETNGDIEMDYADEFTDAESTSGEFKSISLSGYLARTLAKVSKSLLNNSDFDLLNYVINKMATNISKFIEKKLLNGDTNKINGLLGVKQTIQAAASNVVTSDELIDVQEEVPDSYQEASIWIMNRSTRKAIRKLKDGQGNYLLNKDANSRWGYTLFGKDVYTSANMPGMEAGKTAIYYGDMSGLATNVQEDINITVLREKYADQHCLGVLGFVQLDAKVQDAQKISKLVMKAA